MAARMTRFLALTSLLLASACDSTPAPGALDGDLPDPTAPEDRWEPEDDTQDDTEDPPEVDPEFAEADDIDSYVRGIGVMEVEEPQMVQGAITNDETLGAYHCTIAPVAETRQYDEIVAYAANSESLWPGAMVQGDSIASGLFTQIAMDRSPLEASVSLFNLVDGNTFTMEDPSLSVYRAEISDVLSSAINGSTPANIFSEIEEVHSEEQLALALGASVSWLGSNNGISSSFNFGDEVARSRYLVRYVQAYYTVDVDQPVNPSDFMAPGTTLAEVSTKIDPGSPPLYVSSVTYGRLVVFTFESSYSASELGAALDFAYNDGIEITGNTSLTYSEILSDSTITAYILGGSGGAAAQAIDSYENLTSFINEGGDFSAESPAAPIAYKLAYLGNNQPARFSFTEDYEFEECERISQTVRVSVDRIEVADAGGDLGDSMEVYGDITVTAVNEATLMSKSRDEYVEIQQGASWPQSGVVGEAAITVTPQPGESIFIDTNLFDNDCCFDLLDDELGSQSIEADFSLGWRRGLSIHHTGSGADVIVHMTLQPI